MNKTTHHSSYISNPIEVIKTSSTKLFNNLGIVAAHFGISLAVIFGFGVIFGLSFLSLIIDKELIFVPIIIGLLLILPFAYALSWLGLASKRITLAILDDKKPVFKEVFANDTKKVFGLIGMSMLIGVAALGGYLFFIIPGIILVLLFSYAPFIYVKKEIGVVDALGQSFTLVKSSFVELLGVHSIFFVYRAVSYVLSNIPLLGILFSMVLLPIDMFVAYLQEIVVGYRYTSLESGLTRPAKPDGMNWVFIWVCVGILILAIIAFIGLVAFSLMSAGNSPAPAPEFQF